MLKTASVVGRVFSHDVLRDVYPVAKDLPRLRDGLADNARADLTRLESPEPDLAYLFKHVIVQDVAYESLPFAQRRSLHRALAERYEREGGAQLDALAPLLAHHWDVAREPLRAIPHFERAGEQAVAGFAHREAIGFLERAKALASGHDREFSAERVAGWESLLGESHIQLSDFVRAEQHLRNALALSGHPVPLSAAATIARSAWEAFRQVAHCALRPSPGGSAHQKELLRRASHDVKRYAETVFFNNQQLGVVYGILRCLNLAERSGARAEMIDGYASMGVVAGLFRLRGVGRWYFARAHKLAVGESRPTDLARTEIVFATAHADWKRAHRAAQYGCEVHGQQGARYLWEACRSSSGYMYLLTGPLGESHRCFEESFASARYGALQSRLAARAGQVAAGLTCVGRADAATLADYATQLRYNTHRTEATLGEGLQAWAAARDGRHGDAEDHATRALALMREAPPNIYYSLWGIAGCCEAFLALWEARHPSRPVDEWRRAASEAAFMMRRFAWMVPMAGPRAALYRGRVASLSGRAKRAARLWKSGLALAERFLMPYDRALLEMAIGQQMGVTDSAKFVYVDAAKAHFAALGAEFDHARAVQAGSDRPRG
jgi:tetratricopeptide (TPR) repeat protein